MYCTASTYLGTQNLIRYGYFQAVDWHCRTFDISSYRPSSLLKCSDSTRQQFSPKRALNRCKYRNIIWRRRTFDGMHQYRLVVWGTLEQGARGSPDSQIPSQPFPLASRIEKRVRFWVLSLAVRCTANAFGVYIVWQAKSPPANPSWFYSHRCGHKNIFSRWNDARNWDCKIQNKLVCRYFSVIHNGKLIELLEKAAEKKSTVWEIVESLILLFLFVRYLWLTGFRDLSLCHRLLDSLRFFFTLLDNAPVLSRGTRREWRRCADTRIKLDFER